MFENTVENLSGLPRQRLAAYLLEQGAKPAHASALLRRIHTHGAPAVAGASELNAALTRHLHDRAEALFPSLEKASAAADGTHKYLARLSDGNRVESVLIPSSGRLTLCVSSQTGCGLGCAFCATARQHPCRNLSAAEIVGQLWLANRELRADGTTVADKAVTNVVFMGMGEPLLNRQAVFESIEIMRDDYAYALGRRKIVISTVGYVPGIRAMARLTDVGLTVSLHAPDDPLRDRLVPMNRKYPIEALIDACWDYLSHRPRGETVTFAYTLLSGINDGRRQAERLADLLGELPAKVNLIPFNAYPGAAFHRSSPEVTDMFRRALLDRGVVTTVRRSRGDDIAAACGQLRLDEAEAFSSDSARCVGEKWCDE